MPGIMVIREGRGASNEFQSPSRSVYRINRGGADQIVNLSICELCNKPQWIVAEL